MFKFINNSRYLNWNTKNVTKISFIFEECSSLSSLPDISKWNTDNVNNMYGIFTQCSMLIICMVFLHNVQVY